MTPRIACGDSPPHLLLALSKDEGTTCSLVAAAEHPLAQDTRDRPDQIAHRFQLRPRNAELVPEAVTVGPEDLADRGDVAPFPGGEHLSEALTRTEEIAEAFHQVRMGFAEACVDFFEVLLGADLSDAPEAEGFPAEIPELKALGMADPVGRLLESGTHGSGIQRHDPEVGGPGSERHMADRAVGRTVVRSHAGLCEEDHDLVEIPAGGADVVVLHGLGQIDEAHVAGHREAVHLGQRNQEIQRQGGGAGHSASGDVAEQDGIHASGEGARFLREHPGRPRRETGPGVGKGPGLRQAGEIKVDESVTGKVPAEEAEPSRVVGTVGHPEEAVRSDAEEFHPVVVPVLHPEAEA